MLLQLPPQAWAGAGTQVDMQVTWADIAGFGQWASWLGLFLYPVLAGGGVAWGRALSIADKGPFLRILDVCKGILGTWGLWEPSTEYYAGGSLKWQVRVPT